MSETYHILIVDDNQDILTMLTTMLKIKGFQVSTRNEAASIFEAISEVNPDVLLMDMLLSGADGRVVCAEVKSKPEYSSLPIILFTAHSDARESCMKSGADYFIEKPFEMNHLLETLKTAADSRKSN